MFSLVLIPGLASDASMWSAQLQGLAPWRPVVAQAHQAHESIEAMADAVLRTHDGPLVLCGASMGGMIAMEAARQQPARIAGLALLGTTAQPENDGMRAVREAAIAEFAAGRVREVIEPNIAFAFHPDHDPALARAYLDFVLGAGAETLIRQNRAVIARPDARAHLPRLTCPVLVMCGDSDALAAPACSHKIASLAPRAELEMLPRCGHMLTMEQPDAVNARLARWLASLAA